MNAVYIQWYMYTHTHTLKRVRSCTVINCGGSSRLDDPRTISRCSFVDNLWQTRNCKGQISESGREIEREFGQGG